MAVQTTYNDRLFLLTIDQGDDEQFFIRYKNDDGTPIDLTGYNAQMIIQWGYAVNPSTNQVIGPAGTIVLSSATDAIVLGDETGEITVNLSDTVTNQIPPSGNPDCFQTVSYQLRITSADGATTTLLMGPMQVYRKKA